MPAVDERSSLIKALRERALAGDMPECPGGLSFREPVVGVQEPPADDEHVVNTAG